MPGDQILADRGFTLEQDFALDSGSELIIPAFTKGKKQLPAKEINESTRKIASVRIHILYKLHLHINKEHCVYIYSSITKLNSVYIIFTVRTIPFLCFGESF